MVSASHGRTTFTNSLEGGDSVRATINPGWIDVNVGLSLWPSSVHGLIANPDGNANHIQARDGFVLTNPFNSTISTTALPTAGA